MADVRGTGVPGEPHSVLAERTGEVDPSLRGRPVAEAARPALEEVLGSAGRRTGGAVPLEDAVAVLREDRARR